MIINKWWTAVRDRNTKVKVTGGKSVWSELIDCLLTFKIQDSVIKLLTWKDGAIAAVQPIPHLIRNGFILEDKHGRCTRSRRHRHRPHGTSIKVMVWSDKWWPQSTRNITQPVQTQRGIYDTWSVKSQVAWWEAKAKAPAIIRRPIGKVMRKSSRPDASKSAPSFVWGLSPQRTRPSSVQLRSQSGGAWDQEAAAAGGRLSANRRRTSRVRSSPMRGDTPLKTRGVMGQRGWEERDWNTGPWGIKLAVWTTHTHTHTDSNKACLLFTAGEVLVGVVRSASLRRHVPWQHCYPIGSVAVETENELASCRVTRLGAFPVLQLCVSHVVLSGFFVFLCLSTPNKQSVPPTTRTCRGTPWYPAKRLMSVWIFARFRLCMSNTQQPLKCCMWSGLFCISLHFLFVSSKDVFREERALFWCCA